MAADKRTDMKLLRFDDPGAAGGLVCDPRVTVVSGASAELRAGVIAALNAVACGAPVSADLVIEVQDVEIPVNSGTSGLLVAEADPSVRLGPEDLGVVESDPGDRAEIAAAIEREGRAEAVREELRLSLGTAREDVAALDAMRVEMRRAIEDATALRSRLAAELDPTAPEELAAATLALDALVEERRAAAIERIHEERNEIQLHLDLLQSERDALARAAAVTAEEHGQESAAEETSADEPSAVEPSAVEPSAVEPAAAVADPPSGFGEVVTPEHIAAGGEGAEPLSQQIDELTSRRDAAREALHGAESDLAPRTVPEEQVWQLEAIHDEIFDIEHRMGGMGANRLRRRLVELETAQSELLGSLGFTSWRDYVSSTSQAVTESDRQRRVDVARAALELAEEELARAIERAAEGPAGPAPAVKPAQRTTITPQHGHAPEIVIHDALEDAAPDSTEARLEEMEREIERARFALMAIGEPEGLEIELSPTDAEVAPLLERVANARRRAEQHRARVTDAEAAEAALAKALDAEADSARVLNTAVAAVERLEASHEEATRRATKLAEERAAAEAAAAAALDEQRTAALAALGTDGLEWATVRRVARLRRVSSGGSVPLVIDEAFDVFDDADVQPVLERLDQLADLVQTIVFTRRTDGWAAGAITPSDAGATETADSATTDAAATDSSGAEVPTHATD
jgi:uncharacterized protein YhaN